jgi:hypothetical protein
MKFINDMCGTRITKHCHDLGLADIEADAKYYDDAVA